MSNWTYVKVLVAVLGNYTEYDPVNYELDGKVVECVRSSASAVKAVKGPDRTFTLIPFSLYHNVFGTPEEREILRASITTAR